LIEHDTVVYELADLLIARYGERAASHARLQSLKAAQRDDPRVTEAWRWIAEVVEELWRAEPESVPS
jgi:hypothetical protein